MNDAISVLNVGGGNPFRPLPLATTSGPPPVVAGAPEQPGRSRAGSLSNHMTVVGAGTQPIWAGAPRPAEIIEPWIAHKA